MKVKKISAVITGLVLVALPAAASAESPQYWGGPMGKNLPKASITFKVSDGKVRHLQSEVRVHCRAAGGGPAPNSQLIDLHGPLPIEGGSFKGKKRNVFAGGATTVEGSFSATIAAAGFYKARYRLDDQRSGRDRVCHTGKQPWKAEPMSREEWKELRNYG